MNIKQYFKKVLFTDYFGLLFIALTASPLVYASFFVHPHLDDYSWPYVLKTQEGFWNTQVFFYEKVNGRLLSTIISTLCMPYDNFYSLYKLSIVVYLLLFFYIMYAIFKHTNGNNALLALTTTGLFLFCFIFYSKQLSAQFFWLTGVIVYQGSFLLVAIFIYLSLVLSHKINSNQRISFKFIFLYVFTGVGSILFFEMAIFAVFLTMLIPAFFAYRNKKFNIKIIALFFVMGLATIANIKAPGTSIKKVQYSNQLHNHDIVFSAKQTVSLTYELIVSMHFAVLVCYMLLLFFIASKEKQKSNLFSGINPFVFIFLMFAIIFTFYISHTYMLGTAPPYRVNNFIYLIVLVYASLFSVSLASKKWFSITNYTFPILSLQVIFILFLIKPSGIRVLYGDIINKRDSAYDKAMKNYYSEIKSCSYSICFVDSIKNPPLSIMYQPLPSDSLSGNSFYCRQLGYYYGKKWVFSKKETEE